MARSPELEAALAQARESSAYDEARAHGKRALALAEKAFADDGPEHAAILREVAEIYCSHYEFATDAAESLLEQALAIQQKLPGGCDPNELADTLWELATISNFHERAEPLFTDALARQRKALGADHPDVATTLHGLADHYWVGARWDPRVGWGDCDPNHAEPLLEEALRIRQKACGPEHPKVAATLASLGGLHAIVSDNAEQAEACYRQALRIREKAFGAMHWEVASSLYQLARFYLEVCRKSEQAEPLFERALAIWEEDQGPEGPALPKVLIALAEIYARHGRLDDAEQNYRRAIAIEEGSGDTSYRSDEMLVSLAKVVQRQGRQDEAAVLYRRVLEIRTERYGPDARRVTEIRDLLALL